MPFWALSHLITLWSHDLEGDEGVEVGRRIFDFLLGRNPGMGIYLEAAVSRFFISRSAFLLLSA